MADQRAVIDVICKTGVANLAKEIGALLGQDLTCSDIKLNTLSKATLFSDSTREKSILTRMKVTGETEGNCFLLTRLDTAISLGGTLIMLPADMIQENIQSGKLDGEMADAFGEIANIIAGVFTQAFVDKYPKTIRFIKNSVEELNPAKIDMDSDQPFPPGNYYLASGVLSIADKNLGAIEFVVPTEIFGLEEVVVAESAPQTTAEEKPAVAPVAPTKPAAEPEQAPATELKKPVFADAKKLTDVIFKATISQLGEEIGALLDKDLSCSDIKLEMVKKTGFFRDYCLEKSAMSLMKISGDRDATGFLFIQLADAIILGGTLIMLPEEQISEQVTKSAFDGEAVDAYGEVANILCGALTQVFLDRYPKKLRFVRTETEVLIPTKLDPESDQPFPEGDYYLASFAISMKGYELHRISLLFPAEVFDLYPGQKQQSPAAAQAEEGAATLTAVAPAASGTNFAAQSAPTTNATKQTNTNKHQTPIVLLISERPNDAAPFVEILTSSNFSSKVLSYQDDIKTLAQQHQLIGIFLIMSQVSEKGFATAIKLQSLSKPAAPLIFAGPDWTRSTVMRAVKYGARDILMLPASNDEIQEKISHHILIAS